MFENNLYQNLLLQANRHSENIHARRYNTAMSCFGAAMLKGKISRIRQGILRRQKWLYDLSFIKSQISLRGSYYAGIKVVSMDHIIGTEGRSAGFDIDFYPLSEESRERWVNMALVYLSHTPLPPVELIQVGDRYFVRDGHHRISVARAFGQAAMDAEVIVWKAHPPFPWETNIQFRSIHLTQSKEISGNE